MFQSIDITSIISVIGVILVSMTLHEVMHAYVSYWLGDNTAKMQGRLSINPIKHIDPFLTLLLPVLLALTGGPIFGGAKPVPFNPNLVKGGEWGAALVAIAGPLTNLLIAFVSYGLLSIFNIPEGHMLGDILIVSIFVNMGFFVFNMIPIPPLDGSRILYALAPDFARRIMEKIESFGIIVVFLIILIAGDSFSIIFAQAVGFFVNLFQIFFNSI